jgi:hypothetical protein
MTSSSDPLLTNTKYFQWKSHMEDLLRSKGLYHITIGKELEPTNDEKKIKWENRNDEGCGLIGMSISPNLMFHLQGIDDPVEAWEKLE